MFVVGRVHGRVNLHFDFGRRCHFGGEVRPSVRQGRRRRRRRRRCRRAAGSALAARTLQQQQNHNNNKLANETGDSDWRFGREVGFYLVRRVSG